MTADPNTFRVPSLAGWTKAGFDKQWLPIATYKRIIPHNLISEEVSPQEINS